MGIYIPTYFSSIAQYALMLNEDSILFEREDNYQKQSYRNRCFITGPNGKQLLSIPVKFSSSNGRQKSKEIRIENDFPWQKQHLKSLQTTYRSSPFYELLEADLMPIFSKKYEFLFDVNMATLNFVLETLQLDIPVDYTNSYELTYEQDYRDMAHKKFTPAKPNTTYIQMFDEKNGFLPNLSILDLLFMEGPNTLSFL